MKTKLLKILPFIILICIFIIIKLPSLVEPMWVADEGLYAAIGHMLLVHGNILYINAWDNKPPSIYYLFMFSHILFSSQIVSLRVLLALEELATGIFIYNLISRWFPNTFKKQAVASLIVFLLFIFFDGNIVNGEVLFTFFSVFSLYILKDLDDTKSVWRYLIAGLIMGFGITFKMTAFFDAIPIFVLLIIHTLDTFRLDKKQREISLVKTILYTISLGMPLAIYGIYFFINHAFYEYIHAILLYNQGYVEAFNGGIHIIYIHFFILIIIGAILIWQRKRFSKYVFFLLLWLFCAYFSTLLSGRPYFHYLMQLEIPVSLLVGILIVKKDLVKSLLFILGFYLMTLYFYRNGNYYLTIPNIIQKIYTYTSSYEYILGMKSKDVYYANYFIGDKVSSLEGYAITNYINNTYSGKMLMWGDVGWLYSSIKLDPICSKYPSKFYFSQSEIPGIQTCVMKMRPNIIIIQRVGQYSHVLDNILQNYYIQNNQFQSFALRIYVKR